MKVTLAIAAAVLFVVMATTVDAASECTPGDTKKEDCNTCRCTPTGVWVCTRKGCVTKREADESSIVKREVQSCTPNSSFRIDCNTCTCNSGGTSASCTLLGCLNSRRRLVKCAPGTTFKDQCNVCRCSIDGRSGSTVFDVRLCEFQI
ncbi:serine protease inhibitor I/II-like [Schistocerca serialis cubense]|uniref:serine protease inhibitor I/II-like n=1 Tax=Schistocerca serialis cubense TaxID=2023355 RepID=UPI00214F428C|nr:serine protease inhibitor I/II-like [Schistocerca serialis cubense]